MSLRRALSLPLLLLTSAWVVHAGVLAGPPAAAAAVEHGAGYLGAVDGARGWFGSYQLAGIGTAWCVDHGIAAPDAALGYEATDLGDHAPDTKRALAWAVGRYGVDAGPVDAAALMLVLHDLMGARYPSGPLSVDALDVSRLEGFDGAGPAVLDRAREIRADAVAHAGVVMPAAVVLEAETVPAGRAGTLRARLTGVDGTPVTGVVLHPAVTGAELTGDVDVPTDADGAAAWPYTAGAGSNRFDVAVEVPSTDVEAFRPTAAPAQRVVRPSRVTVTASAEFEGVVPRTLTIVKHGDAEPDLPVTGASFSVDGGAPLAVGADGTASLELLPGHHDVTEVSAPAGYDAAGPWGVDIGDADAVLEVRDLARRGRLRIDKVDAVTGAPLDGARFRIERLRDGAAPAEATDLAALLPGRYRVTETEPPVGYLLSPEPVEVDVVAGAEAVARLADRPVPPPPPPPPPPAAPVVVQEVPPPAPPPVEQVPPEVAVEAAPPVERTAPAPPAPEAVPELPRTGGSPLRTAAVGLALLGVGLVLTDRFGGPRRPRCP